MSLYDSRPEKIKLETSEATSIGRIQHFTELTVGAGTECIVLNKEGAKFGGRTFSTANAYIKTDGTYKFKDGNGNVVMDNVDGVQMLKDATVTTAALANLSVDTSKLANLAVEAAKLADSSVESTKIANAAVGSAAIAALAVGTAHIANGAIINAKINDLDAGKINAETISADRIGADTITADKLNVSTLSAISANMGTLTAGTIYGGTIATSSDSNNRIGLFGTNDFACVKGGTLQFAVVNSDASPHGDQGDVIIGNTGGKYVKWDSSAGTLTIRGALNADDITAGKVNASYVKMKGYFEWYEGGDKLGEMGIDTDDNIKIKSDGHDIELKVSSSRSIGMFVNGTREMLCNGDGDWITRSNNTNQVGTDATAWKKIVAYTFTDKCLWLDEEDDLAILKATKPKKDKNGKIERDENGKARLDHYSLPDWIHTGNSLREEIKRKKPEVEQRIKEVDLLIKKANPKKRKALLDKKKMLQEELSNYDLTEEEIVDRTGRNMGHFLDLVAGAVRQLDKKVEKLEKANSLLSAQLNAYRNS